MKYFFVLIILLMPTQSLAKQSFNMWLKDFKVKAAKNGISERTISAALSNLSPNPKVIELDRNQPNVKWTFAKYRERIVHPDRIKKGQEAYKNNITALKNTESLYGVPAEIIVALWGVESNYGATMGDFDVIRSLATLAWDGRREKLFTEELMAALKIIDQGHITRENMKGSWAGAMGQCQFMPTSFKRLARDGSGDGRKDIWGTKADVFASAAYYLSQNGWKRGERWGREVIISKTISSDLLGTKTSKPLSYWQSLGVRLKNGSDLPAAEGFHASLIAPDGLDGSAFLVYDNFKVIMKWNSSTYFAASVGLIADNIAR
jgi:membrane-bound lytic murein transglycosylase B